MKIRFGMKAAPLYMDQLQDRVDKFAQLEMDPLIELHFFGDTDVFDKKGVDVCLRNCESIKEYKPKFIVHFPYQNISGKIFDPFVDGNEAVLKVLDFTKAIKADSIVVHRYCCLNGNLSYSKAVNVFNHRLKVWAEEAEKRGLTILVENSGFIWLPAEFNQEYIVTALDHFFPWEIRRFNEFLENEDINNVFPAIDIAHAAISINMLKLWRKFSDLRNDQRFSNITLGKFTENKSLTIEAFINEAKSPYLHFSDAFLLKEINEYPDDLDLFLKTEGLPIGDGNIDFNKIITAVKKTENDVIIILEIDSPDGNHNNNLEQFRGIIALQEILKN
tara:strand:+ start:1111 stop:2106 length:996 start_codon:yes stop_codon:yes gene_type:complete